MLTLQIISALLLLLNKYYLRKNNSIGWIYGIFGATIVNIYFYLQMVLENKSSLWILIIFDFALIILMVYGYLVAKTNSYKNLQAFFKRFGLLFKIVVVILSISVSAFLFVQSSRSALIFSQFVFASTALFGTLLLAFGKRKTNIIGWFLYFISHTLCIDLMIKIDSYVIAVFQVLSALIAIDSMYREYKKK